VPNTFTTPLTKRSLVPPPRLRFRVCPLAISRSPPDATVNAFAVAAAATVTVWPLRVRMLVAALVGARGAPLEVVQARAGALSRVAVLAQLPLATVRKQSDAALSVNVACFWMPEDWPVAVTVNVLPLSPGPITKLLLLMLPDSSARTVTVSSARV